MKRILLKISWEALSWESGSIDSKKAESLTKEISILQNSWIELVLVFWGGNIYRWSQLISAGLNGADSHNMSMLSTVFNSVTIKNFLDQAGVSSVVLDALHVEFLETYSAIKAREYLEQGRVVICSSGTWVPFFTTDTGGVTRALETGCEAVIKLTKVDGVYDSDPVKDPHAQKFDTISYDDFITQDLKVLDQTAIIMARDTTLPIYVMSIDDISDIPSLLGWKTLGTKIH